MKRFLLSVAMSVCLSSTAFAQIPVTDGASIATQVMNQVETIAKWRTQYNQMVEQINQARQQYEALTGSRGLGLILNDPALREYLPEDWQGVYDEVKNGGYSGLSGRAAGIYAMNRIFDSCLIVSEGEQRRACEARAVKASQDKGFALDAFEKAKLRITQIDQLMTSINYTEDPKAIAELQGRIAAEQANIQNEQTKLQLYAMVAAAEEKVQAQRQREIQAKTWAAQRGIQVRPMSFD